jgi:hypothetical protein
VAGHGAKTETVVGYRSCGCWWASARRRNHRQSRWTEGKTAIPSHPPAVHRHVINSDCARCWSASGCSDVLRHCPRHHRCWSPDGGGVCASEISRFVSRISTRIAVRTVRSVRRFSEGGSLRGIASGCVRRKPRNVTTRIGRQSADVDTDCLPLHHFAAGTHTASAVPKSTPGTSVLMLTRCKPAFLSGLA